MKSKQLFQLAQRYIPGGVNSPVRAFRGVGGEPVFIQRGQGPYLIDADGNQYIDYIGSWGPLILGHAHPVVVEKVKQALYGGFSFGTPTEIEVLLAKKVSELMPAIEMLRCVSSGTEAVMSALRLARGYTKRDKILKFAGNYHGHSDSVLVSAGSGALTLGVPSSSGVPDSFAQHTLVAEYNRLDEVKALFALYGEEIAAIIVEPVAANMNLVLPVPGFLAGLRELCDQYGSLLIFDEVITGFRISLGGAQAYYDVVPDLTILGKVLGGGFPAAAFGGQAEIMRSIAPLGPVYQAGTLSGNPIAMTAGLATLEQIAAPDFHAALEKQTQGLVEGLRSMAKSLGLPLQVQTIGSLFGLFFTDVPRIETESDVKRCNMTLFKHFFHGMLNEGVYLAPSAFEVGFVSSAHTEQEIEFTLASANKVLSGLLEAKPECIELQI